MNFLGMFTEMKWTWIHIIQFWRKRNSIVYQSEDKIARLCFEKSRQLEYYLGYIHHVEPLHTFITRKQTHRYRMQISFLQKIHFLSVDLDKFNLLRVTCSTKMCLSFYHYRYWVFVISIFLSFQTSGDCKISF